MRGTGERERVPVFCLSLSPLEAAPHAPGHRDQAARKGLPVVAGRHPGQGGLGGGRPGGAPVVVGGLEKGRDPVGRGSRVVGVDVQPAHAVVDDLPAAAVHGHKDGQAAAGGLDDGQAKPLK